MEVTNAMLLDFQLESRLWIFQHDLRILNDHITSIEQQLSVRRENLLNLMNEELANRFPSDIEPAGGEFTEELWKTHDLLPTIHRHSTLLMIVSYLEAFLDGVCQNVASIIFIPRIGQYRYSNGATEYLEFSTGADLTKLSEWQTILLARAIRNHIAHNNGRLTKDRLASEKLRLEIEKSPDLRLDERDKLVLNVPYLQSLLVTMQSFSQKAVRTIVQCVETKP